MEDERVREFGTRLIFFEARSCLPKEVVDRLDRETAERLAHPGDKPMSLNRCLDEIQKLEENRNADQPMPAILNGFREYVMNRKARVSAFMNG